MARCRRCFLESSMKLANIIILLFGIGLIIYSLWLDRQWHSYVFELLLPTYSASGPTPWFIYSCMAVGIAVSLSTLCGYTVANYSATCTLCAYIFSIGCLLFLEAAAVVLIFFKMDLAAEIAAYVDVNVEEIESFVNFHVKLSRVIILLVLVAQVDVVGLAVIFWAIGIEPRIHSNERSVTHFTESFLVPNFPEVGSSRQACTICGYLQVENPPPTLLSYIHALIRAPFQRRNAIT